jgi:hypothetical protein
LDRLPKLIALESQSRVCRYLVSCSEYLVDVDERQKALSTAFDIALKHNQYTEALRYAIKMENKENMLRCFEGASSDK